MGTFNSYLRVFLGCNFAISLLSSIRFSEAPSAFLSYLFLTTMHTTAYVVSVCR